MNGFNALPLSFGVKYIMKEQIIKLRSEGKTYREIQQTLGCAMNTIAFHCSPVSIEIKRAKRKKITSDTRKKNRIRVKLHFGGKCSICGYDKCLDALQFHHQDDNKESHVANTTYSWAGCLREAQKCKLVCANCHAEIHAKERMVPTKGLAPSTPTFVESCSI